MPLNTDECIEDIEQTGCLGHALTVNTEYGNTGTQNTVRCTDREHSQAVNTEYGPDREHRIRSGALTVNTELH